ncbi:MAG: hypothetical protein IJA10_11455 [Lachnospiraceae bacterium]|nr:hypothetical protein [Lachnospiraceae bacterium]
MTKTNYKNLTGQRFGRLVAVRRVEDHIQSNGKKEVQWLCNCDCGGEIVVRRSHLQSGGTQSCGCLKREQTIEFNKTTKNKQNCYDLSGDYGIGWTTNTNDEFYFDLEDYDKIKDYCWSAHINSHGYKSLEARDNNKKDHIIKFQWAILGKDYDHINRNPLDNRKSNLRNATLMDNNRNHSLRKDNTSGVSGVNWHKKMCKWVARINNNESKRILLGYFDDINDAIKARLQAEKKYYGEFAPQQHLYKEYGING